ncbi:MAG: DUF6152 family protein [Pseudomonadota bacterium]
MKGFRRIRHTLTVVALLGAASAFPHHSSAPHFDRSKPVEIEGVVTRFRFVNPHAYLYLDVTDESGETTAWNCEMAAASSLRRSGWNNELFEPGTTVKIDGHAARRDPHGCAFQMGYLEDGTTIARNGPITRPDKAPTVARDTRDPAPAVTERTLEGLWMTTPRRRGGGGPPRGGRDRFASLMTAAGAAALASYDDRFDDPALTCSPSSIIRGWSEPNSVSKLEVSESSITIRHEYMDTVRTVDLTTREHPTDIEPSLVGHSVGWFEGDTLVIDSVGFEAGVLLPHPGLMHSDKMHVVERLTLSDDGSQLIRDYAVTDPDYLTGAYTGRSSWTRTNVPLGKYDCTELSGINNVRSQ